MRLLHDENIPVGFAGFLQGHDVLTVQGLGWSAIKNGALLHRAVGVCDVFVTLDRSLEFQQKIKHLSFGVIVIIARSSRISDLTLVVPNLIDAIGRVEAGQVLRIGD